MKSLQLLAPARDAEIARIALMHGADAVYIGGPTHGARAAATNSISDIAKIVRLAHGFGAQVYATLNTIIYEDEIASVENLVRDYWRIGVDALIVQDMGLLRMKIPPIALHASTQCDIRSVDKAVFLARCGFNQLVLPREFSLDQIREVRAAVPSDVVLEAFVHGALCVSYSGDCHASCVANGRSANRGECAQMCRMAYDLVDSNGRVLMRNKHLLSLRDMCRISDLEDMALAGISSFKIEGRLKDAAYVKNVVASYRRGLDEVIAKHPDSFCRASMGEVKLSFTPDLKSAFNRGYTDYFLTGTTRTTGTTETNGIQLSHESFGSHGSHKIANFSTPKWIGQPVGSVVKSTPRMITAKLTAPLANGDGLGFFNKSGEFVGFRLNRIDGNQLFPATPVEIAPGTQLYRNRDTKRDAELARDTATRLIPITMHLFWSSGSVTCTLRQPRSGGSVTCRTSASVTADCSYQPSRTPQKETRLKILSRLGGTNYRLETLIDDIPDDQFIPASVLADLKREAIALLDAQIQATHHYEYRPAEQPCEYPEKALTYHDNVANSLAVRFYRDHGVTSIESALEISKDQRPKTKDPLCVMTTRYCLRRELGACLKEGGAKPLPGPLYLKNKAATYRLDFDCPHCQMHVITTV